MSAQLSPWARKIVTLEEVKKLQEAEKQRDRLLAAAVRYLDGGHEEDFMEVVEDVLKETGQ